MKPDIQIWPLCLFGPSFTIFCNIVPLYLSPSTCLELYSMSLAKFGLQENNWRNSEWWWGIANHGTYYDNTPSSLNRPDTCPVRFSAVRCHFESVRARPGKIPDSRFRWKIRILYPSVEKSGFCTRPMKNPDYVPVSGGKSHGNRWKRQFRI